MRKQIPARPAEQGREGAGFSFNNPMPRLTEAQALELQKQAFRARYPARLQDYKPDICYA